MVNKNSQINSLDDTAENEVLENFESFIKSVLACNNYDINTFEVKENMIGKILISIHVGGSSGGSCWNNDPSVPYRKEEEEIKEDIANEIESSMKEICESVGNLQIDIKALSSSYAENLYNNEIANHYENEYYGNCTIKNLYALDLKDFLKDALCKEDYQIFEKSLYLIRKIQDPIFENKFFSSKEKELLEVLGKFDSLKSNEKARLEKELENLTKKINIFDKNTAKEKEKIEKELSEVRENLNNPVIKKNKMR